MDSLNDLLLSVTVWIVVAIDTYPTVKAQTNNGTNLIQTMKKVTKIMGNVTHVLNNLNKTMTVEDCIKTRQMYPTSHSVTIPEFGVIRRTRGW